MLDCVPSSCTRLDNLLFSESHSRFIFTTSHPVEAIARLSKFKGISFAKIGSTHKRDKNLVFANNQRTQRLLSDSKPSNRIVDLPLEELAKASNAIAEIMNK
jgi:phosphoribosylformylglycinamidine synthase